MSGEWGGAVEKVAASRPLLVALDFDGTLSPLADEPMDARMAPESRAAVEHLAAVDDTIVAFVSGRSMTDLRIIAEHDDASPVLLAGSHGAEFWVPGEGMLEPDDADEDHDLSNRLFAHAEESTAGLAGVWIEPKTFGFGVHTRRARPEVSAKANELVDAIVRAEAPHWRRRSGKDIVEYSFRHEGKDSAIAALRERTGAAAVLFAGDDVTDEDALESLGGADLGIHVGEGPSAADVLVADIAELARLLEAIAAARARS